MDICSLNLNVSENPRHIPEDRLKSLHVSTHLSGNKPGSAKQAEQLRALKQPFDKRRCHERTWDDLRVCGEPISVRDIAVDICSV